MIKEISQQLAQRVEDVVHYLLPKGKKIGNEYCLGNIDGEHGRSLKIHLTGRKAGIWCDFESGGNQSGDLLDLWSSTRKITLATAINEAKEYLGIPSSPIFYSQPSKGFAKPSQSLSTQIGGDTPVMRYLVHERKLRPETLSTFKIGEQGRQIVFPFIRDGEIIFAKYLGIDRHDGKKDIRAEKDCEPCLFGWHTIPANARTINLCEGEIDAMTLYQYGLPALSVPFGGGTGNKHKWLEYEYDRLAVFDEIFLCFDNDKSGHEAADELIDRLGRHRCRIVELPHKDPNACLQTGMKVEEINKYFSEAKILDPQELKRASHYVDQVIETFYPPSGSHLGYTTPWEKVKDKILFRPEELSIWTGINGHGKSQLVGQIMLPAIQQGARICLASLELKPRRLLMRLTRQAASVAEPTEEYIRAIHEWYGDNLWIFDLTGTAKAQRLIEVFQYARQRYGIDVFVIDSFMKLDIAEDDYKSQKQFIEMLCDFKNEHGCHVHLIVHPRKGSDESQMPGKLDYKGTGAISDMADNCFAVWRNKKKEDLIRLKVSGKILTQDQLDKLNESDCLLSCDKQRNGDWEGKIALWFDPASYQYLNHEKQKPIQYVRFSNPINHA